MVWNYESKKGGGIVAITKVEVDFLDEKKELVESGDVYTGNLTAPLKAGRYDVNVSVYDDAGNVTIKKSSLDVTLWREPKTDWKPTDRFNFVDYNRIKNNLLYLHQFANSLWVEFKIKDMGKDILEYTSYWDVDIFNAFEDNLEKINQHIFTQDFGITQHFYENAPFIKWDELNRIESAFISIKDLLERHKASLRRLPFRLGNFKGVRI